MSQEPANPHKYAALSLDQIIGLFLAKLYGWLIRCHEAGAPFVPEDIAQNVAKADALVHAFIRSRAAAQLEHAGYIDAARAMRVPPSMRASPLVWPRLAVEPSELEQVTPSDLLARVEDMIDQFEQADVIGSTLARIIVCALLYVSPEARSAPLHCGIIIRGTIRNRRVGVRPPKRISMVGRGPPYRWPPPFPPIPDLIWDPRLRTHIGQIASARAWSPAFAGVGGG